MQTWNDSAISVSTAFLSFWNVETQPNDAGREVAPRLSYSGVLEVTFFSRQSCKMFTLQIVYSAAGVAICQIFYTVQNTRTQNFCWKKVEKHSNRHLQVAGEEGATNLLVICDDNDGDDENSEDHDKNDDGFANYNLQDC